MLETIANAARARPRANRGWSATGAADVEAGASAGMRTALVFPNNRCELCPLRAGVEQMGKRAVPLVHGGTLLEVARAIVAEDRAKG